MLETHIVDLFKVTRDHRIAISKQWFVQQAKTIYEDIHLNLVHKKPGQITKFEGFAFSDGWFQDFQRRTGISLRRSTKISQKVGASSFTSLDCFRSSCSQICIGSQGLSRANCSLATVQQTEFSAYFGTKTSPRQRPLSPWQHWQHRPDARTIRVPECNYLQFQRLTYSMDQGNQIWMGQMMRNSHNLCHGQWQTSLQTSPNFQRKEWEENFHNPARDETIR